MRKIVPVILLLSFALATNNVNAGWLSDQKAKRATKKQAKLVKKQKKASWKAELAGAKAEGFTTDSGEFIGAGKGAVSATKLTAQLEQLSIDSKKAQGQLALMEIVPVTIATTREQNQAYQRRIQDHWNGILDTIKEMMGGKKDDQGKETGEGLRIEWKKKFEDAKPGDPLKNLRFDLKRLVVHYKAVGRSLKREKTVVKALNQIIEDINALDAKYQSALDSLTMSAGQRFAAKRGRGKKVVPLDATSLQVKAAAISSAKNDPAYRQALHQFLAEIQEIQDAETFATAKGDISSGINAALEDGFKAGPMGVDRATNRIYVQQQKTGETSLIDFTVAFYDYAKEKELDMDYAKARTISIFTEIVNSAKVIASILVIPKKLGEKSVYINRINSMADEVIKKIPDDLRPDLSQPVQDWINLARERETKRRRKDARSLSIIVGELQSIGFEVNYE
jgi:hypothetical protein